MASINEAIPSSSGVLTLNINSPYQRDLCKLFPLENNTKKGNSTFNNAMEDNSNWLIPRLMTPLKEFNDYDISLGHLDNHILPFGGFSCVNGSKTRLRSSCGDNSLKLKRGNGNKHMSTFAMLGELEDDDSLQLDSSLVKCHIKQMDSHIVNANDLLNELESSLATDPHLSTIFNVAKRKCDNEPSLLDQENLLNEWIKNRREIQKKLYPDAYQPLIEKYNVTKPKIKSKLKKSKTTSSPNSKLRLKLQRHLPKKLTLTKPSYIKEFHNQLKEIKMPIKPVLPIIIPKEILIQSLDRYQNQNQNQNQKENETQKNLYPLQQQHQTTHLKPKKKQPITKLREPFITTSFKAHQIELTNGNFPNIPDTIFPCSQCPKSFTQKSQWRRHVECVHLNLVKYHCEFCGKGFKRSDHLKNHSRRMHNQE